MAEFGACELISRKSEARKSEVILPPERLRPMQPLASIRAFERVLRLLEVVVFPATDAA